MQKHKINTIWLYKSNMVVRIMRINNDLGTVLILVLGLLEDTEMPEGDVTIGSMLMVHPDEDLTEFPGILAMSSQNMYHFNTNVSSDVGLRVYNFLQNLEGKIDPELMTEAKKLCGEPLFLDFMLQGQLTVQKKPIASDQEIEFASILTNQTIIEDIGWKDRIKILFGHKIHTVTEIYCKNPVIMAEYSEAVTHIGPIPEPVASKQETVVNDEKNSANS